MKNEQEQQFSTLNENAIRDISVLSPSQKREQERLRKEKEAKKAAEKEKRTLAAEKRRAAEKAEERKRILKKLPFAILMGLLSCIPVGMALAFVGVVVGSKPGEILWLCIPIGSVVAYATIKLR